MAQASITSALGSGPHERFPAERVISDACGGMIPQDGDMLIRLEGRWVFRPASSAHQHDDRYYTKAEIDALLGTTLS